jgi:hypothetical protein
MGLALLGALSIAKKTKRSIQKEKQIYLKKKNGSNTAFALLREKIAEKRLVHRSEWQAGSNSAWHAHSGEP